MNTQDSNNLVQGTVEWFAARLGHVTASCISSVLAKSRTKGEPSSMRESYKWKLAIELMSGKSSKEDDAPETYWIKRGLALEDDARTEYELRCQEVITTCGFLKHATIPFYGCSPDLLIGEKGIGQIKCLNRQNHGECWQKGLPSKYRSQMICELSVTGKEFNEFISYHPDFPDHLKLFVKRIWRKDVLAEIEEMEAAVEVFNAEVIETIRHLPKAESLEQQLEASVKAAAK